MCNSRALSLHFNCVGQIRQFWLGNVHVISMDRVAKSRLKTRWRTTKGAFALQLSGTSSSHDSTAIVFCDSLLVAMMDGQWKGAEIKENLRRLPFLDLCSRFSWIFFSPTPIMFYSRAGFLSHEFHSAEKPFAKTCVT